MLLLGSRAIPAVLVLVYTDVKIVEMVLASEAMPPTAWVLCPSLGVGIGLGPDRILIYSNPWNGMDKRRRHYKSDVEARSPEHVH